jgi:nucleoside-diphosphate-sugar epimerase
MKKKKALITGAAGFVGYHLALNLLKHGYSLTLVDNFTLGRADAHFRALIKNKDVRFLKVDLTKIKEWNKLGKGFDYVYHLAAINSTKLFYEKPYEILRTAILMNINAVDWFKTVHKGGKIMFTSSNEAYAGALEAFGNLPLPTPEHVALVVADPYNPRWSYGATKLIGELQFIHGAKEHNFRMVLVRPHNFYGPRSGHHVIPDVIDRIAKREDPFMLYGADDTRSFCYIDDAVEAMRLVMESTKTDGGTYHIGTAVETKIEDLVEMLFQAAHWRPKKVVAKPSPKGSVKRRLPDVSKIKKHVGWKAVTDLAKGIEQTYIWKETERAKEKAPKQNA